VGNPTQINNDRERYSSPSHDNAEARDQTLREIEDAPNWEARTLKPTCVIGAESDCLNK
jgi:hypothetical protein